MSAFSRNPDEPPSDSAELAARCFPANAIRSGAAARSRWPPGDHSRERATASLPVSSAYSTSISSAACGGVPRSAIVSSSAGSSVIAPRPRTCSTPVRPGTSAARESRSSCTRLRSVSARLLPLRSGRTSVRPSRIRTAAPWSPRGLVSAPPDASQVDSARNGAAARNSATPGTPSGPGPGPGPRPGQAALSGTPTGPDPSPGPDTPTGPGGCHSRDRRTACAQCTNASATSTVTSAPFRAATEPLTRRISPTPGRRKKNETGPCGSPGPGRRNEIRVGEWTRANPGTPPMKVVLLVPSGAR